MALRQVQEIQERENLPGLTQECKIQISELNLPNLFEERIPIETWKKHVKTAIKDANEKEVFEAMMGYKKLKDRKIINDKFGLKKYAENLSVHEARLIFKHRASKSQHVKYNFKVKGVYC